MNNYNNITNITPRPYQEGIVGNLYHNSIGNQYGLHQTLV